MSYLHTDVHAEFFTPPEFPVEVLNAAKDQDVIPCCLPPSAKQFVAFMLLKEYYYKSDNGILVFIQDEVPVPEPLESDPISASLLIKEPEDSTAADQGRGGEETTAKDENKQLVSKYTTPHICKPPLESLSPIPIINLRDKSKASDDEAKLVQLLSQNNTSSLVIICSRKDFLRLIKTDASTSTPDINSKLLSRLRLIIIDNVHEALKDSLVRSELVDVLNIVKNYNENGDVQHLGKIGMVYLTVSLLHYYGYESNGFWRMKETFRKLEQLCKAKVDTSSDIVALLRYCAPLTERVISYPRGLQSDVSHQLTSEVKFIIDEVKKYLNEHVHNPVEALGYEQHEWEELVQAKCNALIPVNTEDAIEENPDETNSLFEEVKNIVHPRTAPLMILQQFESVLELFGPWCANRSLYLLINQIKKMKTRVPYVRHYLLLGLLHSRFILVQAVMQAKFDEFKPLEALEKFSTPKLIAVLSVLRRFNLTTVHEGKLLRQQQELLQKQQEDNDEDNEVTVADFLNSQKQDQSSYKYRGRAGGRRKNGRSQNDRRRKPTTPGKAVTFKDGDGEPKIIDLPSDSNVPGDDESVEKKDVPVTSEQENCVCETTDSHSKDHVVVPAEVQRTVNLGTETTSTNCECDDNTQEHNKVVNGSTEVSSGADPPSTDNVPNSVDNEASLENGKLAGVGKYRRSRNFKQNEDALCGIIFLEDRFHARLLYHFLREAAEADSKLIGLSPTIALSSNPEYDKDSREAEIEYKRREENLRKFRYREANLLVGTSLLEDGIELPKANLVIRFDESKSFRSYLFSKGRAQGVEAEYYVFTDEKNISMCLRQLATYKTVEETLLSHTVIPKPSTEQSILTSQSIELNLNIPIFKTATLSNSISIVNRYCARLPSDSFTRLTPTWSVEPVAVVNPSIVFSSTMNSHKYFTCSLRLPINSPVKWTIKGVPMPSEELAKKAVALQTVMILHKNGELDDALLPVGKEGVTQEPDLCVSTDVIEEEFGEFRPGSTRRRQYYDKQLAPELINCLPSVNKPFYLYWLRMKLTCPLPDDQNTRGRKLHPPEDATQCFGIALAKPIPPMPPFPIYTRCGEVLLELVRIQDQDNLHELTPEKLEKISAFHHYTFTSVLRLDKYLTLFDPSLSENSYYVVPLKACGKTVKDDSVQIDWKFIDRIASEKNLSHPTPQDDESRKNFEFHKEDYIDAVVMPWYRNNDQPQYFYVAEICQNLTPRSQFPGCEFKTFEEYYRKKYRLSIQHPTQPLLDVDHTSARLNFLTPRYVNRKGMALPTSSETTKKAKRENLEQKQILVPELCAIHAFTASLWRQAVCLPCVLYRINALLVANNIRTLVANQVHGLGLTHLDDSFEWSSLSFGWSLSDIFASSTPGINGEIGAIKDKSEKPEKSERVKEEPRPSKPDKNNVIENSNTAANPQDDAPKEPKIDNIEKEEKKLSGFEKAAKEATSKNVTFAESLLSNDQRKGKSLNEILSEEMKKCRQPQLEIGTWSNDMASGGASNEHEYDEEEDELLDPNVALPSNLVLLDQKVSWGGRYKLFNHKVHRALYGSPTHWGEVWDRTAFEPPEDFDDIDNASIHSDMSGSDESFLDGDNNLKIQFEGNTAEALDKRKFGAAFDQSFSEEFRADENLWWNDMCEDDDNNDDMHEIDEDKLRLDFEEEVDSKINEIQNIVKWDELENIPPRVLKKPSSVEEEENEITKAYINLIKELTPLDPPPSFPPLNPKIAIQESTKRITNDATTFSFDFQPKLTDHVGPSPCQILQALTMSNANDGLNLERLETIGDSFLKYAITTYLFCTYENIHEGKLSHLRSKQVSNVHLYRLGRRRGLGGLMIAAKFEPHDNWLPPCYHISKDIDKALIHSKLPHNNFSMAQVTAFKGLSQLEIQEALKSQSIKYDSEFIPYNLVTQQSIPDKSIADSVEALIGAYLTSTGPLGALLFMSWLGVRVLPSKIINEVELPSQISNGELFYMKIPNKSEIILFDQLNPPISPLLRYDRDCEQQLEILLKGYDGFENSIGYKFRDRSYLLQAFTHASYAANKLTDCYQRLEFLGDAILDYLITRHLYEDPRQHSPGSLTDLRSALVNNTIFASLAVKNGFHKYFRHASPGLAGVLQKFVTFQEQHSHTLTQDYYLMGEEECEEAEDIEVPKALGDVFESVAGAIYLDSGMSLDAVWNVYYKIMKNEIEQFSENVPKSPIRELLELEPETAKFGKPEKLWDGRRVRVVVEIFGVGVFRGIGRNYRIAKCTAAKCALRHIIKYKQGHNKRY